MKQILKKLDGKKASIGTILGALITYSLGKGYIGPDEANLLSIILVALGLTANYANSKKQ